MTHDFDYLLVGGGLQNALIALALRRLRPEMKIAILERDLALGGNHTWCFHAGDLSPEASEIVEPAVAHRWSGYDVFFPDLERTLSSSYAAITSVRLAAAVTRQLSRATGCAVLTETEADTVDAHEVTTRDGRTLSARVVIDARGPDAEAAPAAGYQKFVGQEMRLERRHGLSRPILMDATVPQTDGFRFFYVLPLASDRLLIEDTYFSRSPSLDIDSVREEIAIYATARGFAVRSICREERGVLPMPWRGTLPHSSSTGPLVAGYRGGWFHPATGYSFPVVMRLAMHVAKTPSDELFGRGLTALAAQARRQMHYCHVLNGLLFRWFEADQRWRVFERFYRLPEATIRRFYSLEMSATDRARILVGRPPRGLSLRTRLTRRTA